MIDRLKKFVIVGGDAVAPMVAAAVAISLRGQDAEVTLIDPEPRFVGAESLLPQSVDFHRHMRIPQPALVGHTAATFKLATEFTDWTASGESFLHAYGRHGATLRLVPFHHYFVKQRLAGGAAAYNDYSLAAAAARAGKFEFPDKDPDSVRSTYVYGLHVDTNRYAELFRRYSEQAGVRRITGTAATVSCRSEDGFIEALHLEDGTRIEGDFFIDCSGAEARVANMAMQAPLESWAEYLPCNRSIALSVDHTVDFAPITRIVAKPSGWLRRLQLRDRSDYEFFYSADTLADEEARASLLRDIPGASIRQVHPGHFENGVRREAWQKNCVLIGDSAVSLEPLETSAISLAQNAVISLLAMLPDRRCEPAIAAEYNRLRSAEYDNIRDYLCLLYRSVRRRDSAFWTRCGELRTPASLADRLDLFASHGRLIRHDHDIFPDDYWISALLGLGHWPRSYHPLADVAGDAFADERLAGMRRQISQAARGMTDHRSFVLRYLAQDNPPAP